MAKKNKDVQYYEAVGRRKESVARVRLYIIGKKPVSISGNKITKGQFVVNDKPLETVYTHPFEKKQCLLPLVVTGSDDRFAISVRVSGGGPTGQLEAIRHGVSRALVLVDEANKPKLREHDLLTQDPRTRQRRHVGKGGKARRKKQSPKR